MGGKGKLVLTLAVIAILAILIIFVVAVSVVFPGVIPEEIFGLIATFLAGIFGVGVIRKVFSKWK
jgi:hypothetical protein